MAEKIHSIGDRVYFVSFTLQHKTEPCSVCFGNKYITCILGNGEEVTVDCRGCEKGYLGSVGFHDIYEYEEKIEIASVTKVEIEKGSIKYYTDKGFGEDRIFDDIDVAKEKAKELAKAFYAEQKERISRKEKPSKDWTWHAYYHQRNMKQAEKDYLYHAQKLDVARKKKIEFPRKKARKEGEDVNK